MKDLEAQEKEELHVATLLSVKDAKSKADREAFEVEQLQEALCLSKETTA